MESKSDHGGPTTGADAEMRQTLTGAAARKRHESGAEVRNLTADVRDLLSRLAHVADPDIARLRARVERALASARTTLADGTDRVQRQAKNAISVGDLYVRGSPWRAVGIAAAAGLTVGFLVARRAPGPSQSRGTPATAGG